MLAVFILTGCTLSPDRQRERTLDRDEAAWLSEYSAASIVQVPSVLYHQLALADDYEKRGWNKLGPEGWLEHHRAMSEGRLAVFFKASGKTTDYSLHMARAIEHLRNAHPNTAVTSEGVERFINGLDSNFQQHWRKEIGQPAAGLYSPEDGQKSQR